MKDSKLVGSFFYDFNSGTFVANMEEVDGLEYSFHFIFNGKVFERTEYAPKSNRRTTCFFGAGIYKCRVYLRKSNKSSSFLDLPAVRLTHTYSGGGWSGFQGKSVLELKKRFKAKRIPYESVSDSLLEAKEYFSDENFFSNLSKVYYDAVFELRDVAVEELLDVSGKKDKDTWRMIIRGVHCLLFEKPFEPSFCEFCLECSPSKKKKVRKIFLMSFGRSGATAVKDYLLDFKGVRFCPGSEITLFNGCHGLASVTENLADWKNWVYNFIAIYAFGLGSLNSRMLSKESRKSWEILSEVSSDGLAKAFSSLMMNLSEGLTPRGVLDALKDFVKDFSEAVASEEFDSVLYLNPINPLHASNFQFIDGFYVIPVFRDPRSQFIDGKLTKNSKDSVDQFVIRHRSFIDSYNCNYEYMSKNGSVVAVDFDDFVLRKDVRADLLNSLSFQHRKKVGCGFDPRVSRKNVYKYVQGYDEFEEEIDEISEKLGL